MPGDICVVSTGSRLGRAIDLAERIADHGRPTQWNHVVIASLWRQCPGDGEPVLMIVEAMPGGAVHRPWHYQDRPHLWSTGILPYSPSTATAARAYAGVPYGWLDYAALALHSLRLPAPGLREFIASTRSMICSQLAARARQDAGRPLFSDGRWDGYVMPSTIGRLLGA